MEYKYCWRCRISVPMLNEAEYSEVSKLYGECMHATKEFRERHGLSLTGLNIEERFKPVRDAYLKMTGFNETNHNAIMHHRLASLGRDCRRVESQSEPKRQSSVPSAAGRARHNTSFVRSRYARRTTLR